MTRVHTPTVLQMEALECGAACLGSVLGYFGRIVPLEELRAQCGVSRDGATGGNILRAARRYGLEARGYKSEPKGLRDLKLPLIIHWNFDHFVVLEGFGRGQVYLNDPAYGPRTVSEAEFDQSFTGVALELQPGANFTRAGERQWVIAALARRLGGAWGALLFVLLASVALIIPGLVVPAFARVLLDDILLAGRADWLPGLLLVMALTALVRAALTYLQQSYLMRLEMRLALSSSAQFLWHVLRLPMGFFTQRYGGEIGYRVGANDRVARAVSEELATTLLNLILIVFFALLMALYSPVLSVLSIGIALLNALALRAVSRRRVDINLRMMQDRGKMVATAMNSLQSVETLKATGAEADAFARWAGYQAKMLNAQQGLGRLTQILAVVPPLLLALNTAAVFGIGGLQIMQGTLTPGMLVAFYSLMLSFLDPVNQLVVLGGRLQEVEGDLNRLDDVLRYEIDPLLAVVEAAQEPVADARLKGQVELRGVTFGYNPLAPPLIENLDLMLKPGTRVALVGGSGSGKSTIARLVAGLYPAWSGEILFDGQRRDQIPRALLNNSLAMVDQDIFLFEGSVRDNLTLWDHTLPETSILRATKDAAIHDDVLDRTEGYEHRIEEGGRNFSGGQRQRLEIARALVSSPTILILDEATSALDTLTERQIDDHLRRRGCTCLIVAHRLSTIRDADEIIVLEAGKVVQRGTHDELRGQPGLYQQLVSADVSESVRAAMHEVQS